MKNIVQYFKPEKEASYFEELVIVYFIYQVFLGLLLLGFLIALNLISANENTMVSAASEAVLSLFLVSSLFLLKRRGIRVTGNIFYTVMIGVVLVSMNILLAFTSSASI